MAALFSVWMNAAEVLAVAFSPEGKRALSGHQDFSPNRPDGTVCLWDLEERRLVRKMKGHGSWVRGVAFLPDEPYALSGSNDASLLFWNLESGKPIRQFKSHTTVVGGVSVSRFGGSAAVSRGQRTEVRRQRTKIREMLFGFLTDFCCPLSSDLWLLASGFCSLSSVL